MSSIDREAGVEIPLLGPDAPRGPDGIRGWLLLVAFGQVLATFSLPVALAYEFFDPENQKLFGEFPLAMYGELVLNVALILLVLATTLLLFRKSRYFPRALILECIAGPLVPVLGLVWSAFAFSHQLRRPIGDFLQTDTPELTRLALSVISAAIWITYALKSKRVRITFILGMSAQRASAGNESASQTSLLRVIVGFVIVSGLVGILASAARAIGTGTPNYNFVGGAVQIALGVLLYRGSDVARILLAFFSALGAVFFVWIASFPGQGVIGAIAVLTMALLSVGLFWVLVFSKRFRAELEISAAKYRKPDEGEADAS